LLAYALAALAKRGCSIALCALIINVNSMKI